jgi:hypothetical protein
MQKEILHGKINLYSQKKHYELVFSFPRKNKKHIVKCLSENVYSAMTIAVELLIKKHPEWSNKRMCVFVQSVTPLNFIRNNEDKQGLNIKNVYYED